MINHFIEDTPKSLSTLKKSVKKKDWDTVSAVAHELQSGAAIIGIEKMRLILKDIETAATGTSTKSNMDSLVKEVEKVVGEALRELKDFISAIAWANKRITVDAR